MLLLSWLPPAPTIIEHKMLKRSYIHKIHIKIGICIQIRITFTFSIRSKREKKQILAQKKETH